MENTSTSQSKLVIIDKELDPSVIQLPKLYEGCIESVLIQEKDIQKRIRELTEEVAAYYQDRPFIIVVVLKGSFLVFTEIYENLMKIYSEGKYNNKIIPEFIRMRSTKSESKMNEVIMKGVDELDIEGKEILIVEDIVESGTSLRTLLKTIEEKKRPKDVKIFSLLVRKDRPVYEFKLDFLGFEIPNKFCIGFGVDYNEKFRDLYSLCTINQHGLDKFKV